METIEYRTSDKSEWGPGPWQDEPDKRQWADEATGLPCLIVRGPHGSLCGYVGVSEDHPCFEKGYADAKPVTAADDDGDWFNVHGGLTFAEFCADSSDESRHICHVPGPGEPDRVWWLGFDCGHAGDMSPAFARAYSIPGTNEIYRSLAYVIAQCTLLAAQLVPAELE